MPEFFCHLHHSLNKAYSTIRQNITAAYQRNETRYDQTTTNIHFTVGDQVWLYVPAVKTGTSKKLSSLWCGPYTVIDRVSSVNYKIQLLGVLSKTTIVHYNRLKHCFGTPKSSSINISQSAPTNS